MQLIFLLFVMIICFYVSTFLSKWTTIGQKDYFHNFVDKYKIFNKYKYSKVFYCESCHVFWLSIILLATFLTATDTILLSFICYQITVCENKN